MSILLACDSLEKSFGPRVIFRGLSIRFDDSERTGLIGPNGSGKSTLMKILAGAEQPDGGTIESRRNLRLGYLPQLDVFPPGATPLHVVVAAQHDSHAADEHEREIEAQILLGKIGFERFDQPVESLSGGWRKRLAIARELVRKPDLLLLDEPTNHLDLEGILWLEKLLMNAPFAFVLVSHDRVFLENVTNRVVELNRAYAGGYLSISGDYADFLEKREEYLAAQQRTEQALAGQVRREIEWLRRGAKARTTKAKGRIQQAGQMMDDLAELRTRNTQAAKLELDFNATGRQTRKLITAKGVTKSLGGRTLFQDVNFVLSPGGKLGLLGPNGSGKSTLIRILTGQIEPDAGTITRADGLRVILFDQNRAQLDKSATLRQALTPRGGDMVVYRDKPVHVAGWARRFLFHTDQLDLPVGSLSGGEQARILVAQLMLQPADVLILDEPTNDLDIPSLEVLEESLSDFPGALVLVTHDRYMLERLSTELLALDGEGGAAMFASLDQWETAQEAKAARGLAEARARNASSAKPQAAAAPAPAKKPRLSWNEQRELEGIERKILDAESELESLQHAMADPATIADHARMRDVCTRADAAQQLVTSLYTRWQELEAKRS
jgi:ATP-binding cassette subfamily F protein uup